MNMLQWFEVTKSAYPSTERYSLNKNPAFSDVIKPLYEFAEKLWTKKGSPFCRKVLKLKGSIPRSVPKFLISWVFIFIFKVPVTNVNSEMKTWKLKPVVLTV